MEGGSVVAAVPPVHVEVVVAVVVEVVVVRGAWVEEGKGYGAIYM